MRLFISFLAYIHSSPSRVAGRATTSSQIWSCLDLLSLQGIWKLVSNRWIRLINLLQAVCLRGSREPLIVCLLPPVISDFSLPQSLRPAQLSWAQNLVWAAEMSWEGRESGMAGEECPVYIFPGLENPVCPAEHRDLGHAHGHSGSGHSTPPLSHFTHCDAGVQAKLNENPF